MLNELLLRLRNAGVPGAAGAPSVPAEALEAELAPVFALFEQSERAADAIDAEARRLIEQSRLATAAQSRALVDDARARSTDEQNAEAAERFAQADATCAELRSRAAAEVARIDGAVPDRLPPLVTQVVTRIFAGAGSTRDS